MNVLSYRKPTPLHKTSHLPRKLKNSPSRSDSLGMSQPPQKYEISPKYGSKRPPSGHFAKVAAEVATKTRLAIENIDPYTTIKKEELHKQLTNPLRNVLHEKDLNLKSNTQHSSERRYNLTTMASTNLTSDEFTPSKNQQTMYNYEGESQFSTLSPLYTEKPRNAGIGFKKPVIAAAYVEVTTMQRSESPQSRCLKCSTAGSPVKFYPLTIYPGSSPQHKANNAQNLSPNNSFTKLPQQNLMFSSLRSSPLHKIQTDSPKIINIQERIKPLHLSPSSLTAPSSPANKVPGKIYPIFKVLSPDLATKNEIRASPVEIKRELKVAERFSFQTHSPYKNLIEPESTGKNDSLKPIFDRRETFGSPLIKADQESPLKETQQRRGLSQFAPPPLKKAETAQFYSSDAKSIEKIESPLTTEQDSIFMDHPKEEEEDKVRGELQAVENTESMQSGTQTQKETFSENTPDKHFERLHDTFTNAVRPFLKQKTKGPATIVGKSESSLGEKTPGSSQNQLSESARLKAMEAASGKAIAKNENFRKKLEEIQNRSKKRLSALVSSVESLEPSHRTKEAAVDSNTSRYMEEPKRAGAVYSSPGVRKLAQGQQDENQKDLVYPESPVLVALDSKNDLDQFQSYESNDLNYSREEEIALGEFPKQQKDDV